MEATDTNQISDDQTPKVHPGVYSPANINVRESLGTLLLGIISIILLVQWVKA